MVLPSTAFIKLSVSPVHVRRDYSPNSRGEPRSTHRRCVADTVTGTYRQPIKADQTPVSIEYLGPAHHVTIGTLRVMACEQQVRRRTYKLDSRRAGNAIQDIAVATHKQCYLPCKGHRQQGISERHSSSADSKLEATVRLQRALTRKQIPSVTYLISVFCHEGLACAQER